MDREDRDRLDIFRRKLVEKPNVSNTGPADRFSIDDAVDLTALIAAQGKLVAMFAMLLDRERILKASELGNMLATIATITAQETPAEGEILAIWAAGVQDVAAGL